MSISTSVLSDLLQNLPQLRSQIYFKASLIALSHAMEDQVLAADSEQPLLIASFQSERYYRQEAYRYRRIAQRSNQVYVLAAPETDFTNSSEYYETVAFDPEKDALGQEWHLVVIAQHYASCVVCRERPINLEQHSSASLSTTDIDPARQFEGFWSSAREVTCKAADLLLERILIYRPELETKIELARSSFGLVRPQVSNLKTKTPRKRSAKLSAKPGSHSDTLQLSHNIDPDPFIQRLVTYLQAGQYKLLKAYGSIAAQERKERLVNSITSAIRRGNHTGQPLHPEEILKVAVQELGQALSACRCLIYRAGATDTTATINYEFLRPSVASVAGQTWPLQNNPLFQEAIQQEKVYVSDTETEERITSSRALAAIASQFEIRSWLIVPIFYQGQLLGIVELHHCGADPHQWETDEIALVEAIATQVGAAIIQAEAYANLEDLNQQLEALDRTRSNLIAITGHELRTPLSTIQVCLESLASEPDMPPSYSR